MKKAIILISLLSTYCYSQSISGSLDSLRIDKHYVVNMLSAENENGKISIVTIIMAESKKPNAAYERDSVVDTLQKQDYKTIISNIDSIGPWKSICAFDGYGVWGFIKNNSVSLTFSQDYYSLCTYKDTKSICTIYFNKKAAKIIEKKMKGARHNYLKKNKLKEI
jgi:hypothetical protein